MKNFRILITYFIFIISISSCQKEEVVILENQNNFENLNPNSVLYNLILRIAQNPTSQDNIVDGSSCFNVQLPVTVIVNNQQIIVTEQADYQIVLTALNAFSNDDDLVNFNYPITIKFKNFTTQTLLNKNQLDNVLDDCDKDDNLNEIDCLLVNYPISVSIYNPNNQVESTITIQSNRQLFNFIKNLSSTTVAAINYPISIVNSNGNTIVINSNIELESAIKSSEKKCDDDNIGSNGNPTFTSILSSGTWRITYFFDNEDETSNYSGYNLTFNSNGTSVAIKNTLNINGNWSSFIDSGKLQLLLAFDGLTLNEIEEDWQVKEFNANTIKLKHTSGGNGGNDFLTLTKN